MLLGVKISLALIAVIAGMFLLAKTKKEGLGLFFKIVSWVVVVVSLIVFLCTFGAAMRWHAMRMHEMKHMHDGFMWKHEHGDMPAPNCCPGDMFMNEYGKDGGNCPNMIDGKKCCGGDMETMTPEARADQKVKMLTEKLQLTNEQVPKVKEIILKNFQAKDKEIKSVTEKTHSENMEAIKKILTPEQAKKISECCLR